MRTALLLLALLGCAPANDAPPVQIDTRHFSDALPLLSVKESEAVQVGRKLHGRVVIEHHGGYPVRAKVLFEVVAADGRSLYTSTIYLAEIGPGETEYREDLGYHRETLSHVTIRVRM